MIHDFCQYHRGTHVIKHDDGTATVSAPATSWGKAITGQMPALSPDGHGWLSADYPDHASADAAMRELERHA